MDKFLNPNKENTTGTFYHTHLSATSEDWQFNSTLKLLESNCNTLDYLNAESQTLLQKLTEKITLDESKIEANYLEMTEISKDIEQYHQSSSNDRQIDLIIKAQKETIKQLYAEDRNQLVLINSKYRQQLKDFAEGLEFKEKEVEFQKEEREEGWSKLIDGFQREIVELEREFKGMRNKDEEVFETSSLDLFNLEEQLQTRADEENAAQKKDHETIIKLVSECIERIRYIY